MRRLGQTAAAALGLWLVTVCALTGFVALWPAIEPAPEPADVIVVLGGGGAKRDGTLARSSAVRVDRAVQLWRAGLAPRLHFTGDGGSVPVAEAMARRARRLGVPPEAITTETRARSTLQNALFSRPQLVGAASILLVTESYHLPRAWASFRLSGYSEVQPVHAPPGDWSARAKARALAREALAIWFNLARFVLWRAARAVGCTASCNPLLA